MLYDYIVVDTANLFYRLQKDSDDTLSITKKLIGHIEEEAKAHLREGGIIYLTFDPISKSTLNEEKSFHVSTYSKKNIDQRYKSGRTYSPIYKQSIENLMKYYAYRGDLIKEVYGPYEADDYVEPLLALLPKDATVALTTTDLDWSRSINDKVSMINTGYDTPFTKQEFIDKFQFSPTSAANTLYKALFGDKSDDIQGCIFLRKVKFLTNIRQSCLKMIQYVSDSGMSIDDFIKKWNSFDFKEIIKKPTDDPIECIFTEFTIATQRDDVIGKMFRNIALVRSPLERKPITQYVHSNGVNEKFNEIIEKAIFYQQPQRPKSGWGRLKTK